MCATRKCGNASCSIHVQTCQMIQGKCPKCYQQEQEKLKQQNVLNQPKINKQ